MPLYRINYRFSYGCRQLAGGGGFEPPLTDSESVVLPLDDPPTQILDKMSAGLFFLLYFTFILTATDTATVADFQVLKPQN